MIPKQALPSLEQALSGTLFGNVKQDSNQVVMFNPDELVEIEDQPFRPYTPEKLEELAEDIKENGQINPCTVRKKDGKYIILAGRNRKKACQIAGVKVSCIIIECDDPTANLILVNSNLNQRQKLLPSEKAFAYKLQKESYAKKGQHKTAAAVAEQNSGNVKMVQRYIRLTRLTKELLDMVDEEKLPVTVGVELSYLDRQDMQIIFSYLSDHPQISISVEQAKTIRKLSPLTVTELDHIFFSSKSELETDGNTPNKKKNKKSNILPSVSIKIADLKDLKCDFNFEEATKSEIKEFILDSLCDYFDKSG
jgi:ParB family chromosome partitioning protein